MKKEFERRGQLAFRTRKGQVIEGVSVFGEGRLCAALSWCAEIQSSLSYNVQASDTQTARVVLAVHFHSR